MKKITIKKRREGTTMNLNNWIESLKERFDERTLDYQTVQKAHITLQIKDEETGEIHLHNLEYKAKNAPDLRVVKEQR